jgi:hypothetical protein
MKSKLPKLNQFFSLSDNIIICPNKWFFPKRLMSNIVRDLENLEMVCYWYIF